jgi:hypothetical protein
MGVHLNLNRFKKFNLLRTVSLIFILVLCISNVSTSKSGSDVDSEDLKHLKSQLNKLLREQKIFNLIKKKGKLMKLAMQEDQEPGTEEPSDAEPETEAVEESAEETDTLIQDPLQTTTPEVPEDVVTETPVEAETPAEVEVQPEAEAPVEETQVVPEPDITPEENTPVDTVPEEAPVSETPVGEGSPDAAPAEVVAEEGGVTEGNEEAEAPEEGSGTEDVKKECKADDSDDECLEKRLKSKLVHLLGVFDSLYSSMEEVCQASETVCKKILDRIKEFENLRPESNEVESEQILKDVVKETAGNVFEIAKQQLELKGEDNIKNLEKIIQKEGDRLIEGFKSELDKFENEDQLRNQIESQTTKVLKNLVENFYLNDYLKTPEGEAAGEDSESTEAQEEMSDPEDSLIKEITANNQGVPEETKVTGLAAQIKPKSLKSKKNNKSRKNKMKRKSKKSNLDLDLDSLSDKTALELLSSLLK